jgi:hypothetical protein
MIPFFRKIRKKMADDNRPLKPAWPAGRYLRYAIGEIILVVVGILIALQVNNWNQSKKLKETEIKLLQELNKDLLETKADLLSDIKKAHRELKLTDSIYKSITQNKMGKSILPVKISMAFLYDRSDLYPKKSAYESLRAYGINLVSNDSLRKNITDFFELHLVRVNDTEQFIKDLCEKELGFYFMKISKDINDCADCSSLKEMLSSGSDLSSNFYQIDEPTDQLLHLLKKKYMAYLALKRQYALTQSKIESMMALIDIETKQ